MFATLLQMFALIGFGLIWSIRNPLRIDTGTVRNVLSGVVYYLLLPALVLDVLWRAPLGADTARIAISAGAGVIAMLLASWLICRSCGMDRATSGALMLAAAFPNATYMGLPLLEQVFGGWARSVAVQYDLFACTPLLLTVGIVVAERFGTRGSTQHPLLGLLRVPPLWAALAAVVLNVSGVLPPLWLGGLLHIMGAAVIPLMLLVVGMALRAGAGQQRYLPAALPVLVLQLLVMPLVVWAVAGATGLTGTLRAAVVLEGAMPSMALGVVLSDRYGLNTGVYAAAMTLTTLVSALTLPLWYHWLS